MTKIPATYQRFLVPAIVMATAFVLGYIHQRWMFAHSFHADAAAMQILAQAMVNEASLLPQDFVYGNQLIFLRSSPFIALALALGWSGFDAYVVGSALSLAVWAGILYAAVHAYTDNRKAALALTLVFLIPMGHWDDDFVLGQQSHLSNAVMAICMVFGSYLFLAERRVAGLGLALLPLLLMSAEVPMRAALVLLPLALALLLVFELKRAAKYVLLLGVVLVLGVAANKLLLAMRPVAVDLLGTYVFRHLDAIVATVGALMLEMLVGSVPQYLIAGKKISVPGLLVSGIALAYLILLYGFALVRAGTGFAWFRSLGQRGAVPERDSRRAFPAVVAVLGIVTGALAVASLNPDTGRHFIWAYSLLKLSLLMALYQYLTVTLGRDARLFAFVGLVLLCGSMWPATLIRHAGSMQADLDARNRPPVVVKMEALARTHGIKHVFGPDYWRMMPLNATVPGIAAGVLEVQGTGLVPKSWLSGNSWFDPHPRVMYFLKDEPADKVATRQLQRVGAQLVYDGPDGRLWIGPPIWGIGDSAFEWRGCELPAMLGAATPACQLEKRQPAQAGHVSYGPYVKLPKGSYRFELTYAGAGTAGAIGAWDVAAEQPGSPAILARGDLQPTGAQGATIAGRFTVGTGQRMRSIEIRTYSHAGASLRIDRLRLMREQGAALP